MGSGHGCPPEGGRYTNWIFIAAAAHPSFVASNHQKFHEVCCATHKERSPRHDPDHVPGLDQMFFEQALFRYLDQFLDILHFGDRARKDAPIERKAAARLLNGREGDDGAARAMFGTRRAVDPVSVNTAITFMCNSSEA